MVPRRNPSTSCHPSHISKVDLFWCTREGATMEIRQGNRAPRAPSERWVAVTTRAAARQLDGTRHAEEREVCSRCSPRSPRVLGRPAAVLLHTSSSWQTTEGTQTSRRKKSHDRRVDVIMFSYENMKHPRTSFQHAPRHVKQ